jgi:hypothetical protein
MTTIDHPLSEANRVIESGWMDPEFVERVRAEWEAGSRTAERLRASIFDLLGDGFRGRVPVLIEAVVDPELAKESLDAEGWFAIGIVDEASVLRMADGSWFGLGHVDESAINRRMVLLGLADEADAVELRAELADGRKPVWALDPLRLLDMGDESDYRAAMAGSRPSLLNTVMAWLAAP